MLLALVMESGLWSPSISPARVTEAFTSMSGTPPPPSPPRLPPVATASCRSASQSWLQVWGDNFNQPFDNYRWHVMTGQPRKNGEVENYLAANVLDQGGNLVLRTAREGSGYSSGAVDTRGTLSLLYGKIVIRAKLLRGQGIWPAFWLRPVSGSLLPEIDIMEMLGSRPNAVDMTLHWESAQGPTHTYIEHIGPDLSAGFHTYTLVWLPGDLRWYLDGQLLLNVTAHVPNVPMYLTMNTAVGSTWGGYPAPSTQLPQDLLVDFVHVYQYGICTSGHFTPSPGEYVNMSCECRVGVFVLHQVSSTNLGPYNITPAQLAADVDYLRRHHVRFMSLEQFLTFEEGRWKPQGAWVLLTFDDGYSSIYRNARPILAARHIPAVLFLIGSRLDTERFWMSTVQVKSLAHSGLWAIEAHTFAEHHLVHGVPVLQTLESKKQEVVIVHDTWREQAVIRSLTGRSAYAFAFPYGYETPTLAALYSRSYAITFDSHYALAQPGQDVVPRIDLGSPKADVQAIWQHWFAH